MFESFHFRVGHQFVEIGVVAVRHLHHLLSHRVQPIQMLHVLLVLGVLLRQNVVVEANDDVPVVQVEAVAHETLGRLARVEDDQPTVVEPLKRFNNELSTREKKTLKSSVWRCFRKPVTLS